MTIDEQTIAVGLKTAHAEGNGFGLSTIFHIERVEIRIEFAPGSHVTDGQNIFIARHIHWRNIPSIQREYGLSDTLYQHTDLLLLDIWINLHIGNDGGYAKLHLTQHAVPHDLCIIGVAVGEVVY